MRIYPTTEQLEAHPRLVTRLMQKLEESISLRRFAELVKFQTFEFTHDEIQWCLNNDVKLSGVSLFSPVLTAAQLEEFPPTSWEGATYEDEEGNVTPVPWKDFTRTFEVVGGWVLQFRGKRWIKETRTTDHPTWGETKAWVAELGFLTQEEVDAIKIPVEEPR